MKTGKNALDVLSMLSSLSELNTPKREKLTIMLESFAARFNDSQSRDNVQDKMDNELEYSRNKDTN
jgi:hypothetical protein